MRSLFLLAILAAAFNVHGASKCRNGGRILYLDDVCPPGYTDITSGQGGSVSVIGKSAEVKQQEQAFLQERRVSELRYQAQLAQEQRQLVAAENNRQGVCSAIDGQIRAVEIQMRQINGWQFMDQLKRTHRQLRDQQFQLGCGR